MVSRAERAAATRDALLRAAGELLDSGGPDAVTLREVGARAGVSRGAPYGHFVDKDHLLTQLAIDAWTELAERLEQVRASPRIAPAGKLEQALRELLAVSRTRPHLYALMWTTPAGDPTGTVLAAGRSQDVFLQIVAGVVGAAAARAHGALLMSSAHGIAGMEASGHLSKDTWRATGDELVAMLVASIGRPAQEAPDRSGEPDGPVEDR
ncbi:MAG TPA: TetR/AcrR family transcriptional regulator [Cellulomonas sp.]